MSPLRRSLLAVALFVLFTPLMPLLASDGAAQSVNKPYVEEVDVTFPAPNLTAQCEVGISARVIGTVTLTEHPDGTLLIRYRYDHIFTGPGGSISVNRTENAKVVYTVLDDGTEIEHVTTSGALMYHIVLPGYGSIGNNSGHEVFELTWSFDEVNGEWNIVDEQIYSDSGPNNELSEADYDVICSLLV